MREKRDRSVRRSSKVKKTPKRKLFLVCEGENTEPEYFSLFLEEERTSVYSPLIEVIIMEKTGCEKGQSNPLALLKILEKEIRLANDQKITLEYLIQRGINEAIPNDKKMAREVKSRMELMICECLP